MNPMRRGGITDLSEEGIEELLQLATEGREELPQKYVDRAWR